MKSASIPGYFTNYSLRVTATTRLYDAQVDKATRTGHRSVEGIRTYKRAEKLKELSSNVSNHDTKRAKTVTCPVSSQLCAVSNACNENLKPTSSMSLPKINFTNARNCTVNINFTH